MIYDIKLNEDDKGKILYANGCSFTLGDELTNRIIQSWPSILGNMMKKDIVVNHIHPGYVDTDMSSHKGEKTPEEGAKSSIYCALLPPETSIRGQYIWHDCQVVDWVNGPKPAV